MSLKIAYASNVRVQLGVELLPSDQFWIVRYGIPYDWEMLRIERPHAVEMLLIFKPPCPICQMVSSDLATSHTGMPWDGLQDAAKSSKLTKTSQSVMSFKKLV